MISSSARKNCGERAHICLSRASSTRSRCCESASCCEPSPMDSVRGRLLLLLLEVELEELEVLEWLGPPPRVVSGRDCGLMVASKMSGAVRRKSARKKTAGTER